MYVVNKTNSNRTQPADLLNYIRQHGHPCRFEVIEGKGRIILAYQWSGDGHKGFSWATMTVRPSIAEVRTALGY